MVNSGNFKSIRQESIFGEYTDGIKVYLESTEDQFIFKDKWFSQLNDKISFESVSKPKLMAVASRF